MNQVDQALGTVTYWVRAAFGVFLGGFGVLDQLIRRLLGQAGVPAGVQSLVILVAALLFILAVLRLFGGVFRLLLIVFLVLLVLHILVPNGRI